MRCCSRRAGRLRTDANDAPLLPIGLRFCTRIDRAVEIASLDDALLRRLRIGVHVIGPEQTPPPARALAARGIIENVAGYSVFGDYREPNPPLRLIDAVIRGDIDVAIAWGPFAGYSARQHPGALRIVPVTPSRASRSTFRSQWAFVRMTAHCRQSSIASSSTVSLKFMRCSSHTGYRCCLNRGPHNDTRRVPVWLSIDSAAERADGFRANRESWGRTRCTAASSDADWRYGFRGRRRRVICAIRTKAIARPLLKAGNYSNR